MQGARPEGFRTRTFSYAGGSPRERNAADAVLSLPPTLVFVGELVLALRHHLLTALVRIAFLGRAHGQGARTG